MAQIKWLKSAQNDLKDIFDYISKDSKRFAKLQVERIIQRTKITRQHSMAGKEVPEFKKAELRELVEGNFRIIYRIVSTEEVHVLLVHHSARDLTRRLH